MFSTSIYIEFASVASDPFFPLLYEMKWLRGEIFQDYITALEL